MNEAIEARVIDLYDAYVRSIEDEAGVKVAEAKAAIRGEVANLVANTARDVDRETDALIDSTVTAVRAKRSKSMKKQLDYLLDGMTEEDGAYVDPMLDMAFGLGDEHGVDKALRTWTPEDFGNLTVTRYRVAAESTKAAAEFDATVQRVVARMKAAGALTVGAVHWHPAAREDADDDTRSTA